MCCFVFEKVLLKTTKNYKMKSTKLNLKLLGIDFMLQNDGTNRTPIILFLTLKNYFKASSFFLSSQSAHFPSQAFFKDILWLFFRKQKSEKMTTTHSPEICQRHAIFFFGSLVVVVNCSKCYGSAELDMANGDDGSAATKAEFVVC